MKNWILLVSIMALSGCKANRPVTIVMKSGLEFHFEAYRCAQQRVYDAPEYYVSCEDYFGNQIFQGAPESIKEIRWEKDSPNV